MATLNRLDWALDLLTAADTLDKIVPHDLAENAAVVAVTAYTLANLEQPLPR